MLYVTVVYLRNRARLFFFSFVLECESSEHLFFFFVWCERKEANLHEVLLSFASVEIVPLWLFSSCGRSAGYQRDVKLMASAFCFAGVEMVLLLLCGNVSYWLLALRNTGLSILSCVHVCLCVCVVYVFV